MQFAFVIIHASLHRIESFNTKGINSGWLIRLRGDR